MSEDSIFLGCCWYAFWLGARTEVAELNAQGIDRLIIDLRGNIGGSLGFSMLASYMCSDQRPIGYSVTPKSVRKGYDKGKLPSVPMPRTKPCIAHDSGRVRISRQVGSSVDSGVGLAAVSREDRSR